MMSTWLCFISALIVILKSESYKLEDAYVGNTFFDGFDFVSWSNGCGEAVDESTARSLGMINTTSSTAYISVENTKKYTGQSKCRQTVQIQSKKQYDNGLFIVQAKHMPYGYDHNTRPPYTYTSNLPLMCFTYTQLRNMAIVLVNGYVTYLLLWFNILSIS